MPITVTLEDDVARRALEHFRDCPAAPSTCLLCVIAVAVNDVEHHDDNGTPIVTCTCRQPDDRNRHHHFDGTPCRSLYRIDL